jgi:hypothetical protein
MIIGNITITAKEAKAMRNALYIAHTNALINLEWAKRHPDVPQAIEREQDTVEALGKIRELCSLIENDAI